MSVSPYSTVSALPPALLAEAARHVAARPEMWRPLLRYESPERYYVRLEQAADHEVWLLTWLPGQATEIHDHGGSRGALTVVHGELAEFAFPATSRPVQAARRELPPGATRSFGARYIHQISNLGSVPAASIHAYSPALTTMAYYRHDPDGRLIRDRVEGVDS